MTRATLLSVILGTEKIVKKKKIRMLGCWTFLNQFWWLGMAFELLADMEGGERTIIPPPMF